MIILGLTGSIGMGKSTTAKLLRRLSVPTHEADAAVHHILANNPVIAKAFPDAVVNGRLSREKLGQIVFSDSAKRQLLEQLVHPLVRAATNDWLQAHQQYSILALDIPLLFETGQDQDVDLVLLVTAPAFLQRQRVLRRRGMTAAKFAAIKAAQWPDAKKRRHAHVIIQTGLGEAAVLRQLRALLATLRQP